MFETIMFIVFGTLRLALSLVFFVSWIAGIIIANGFWSTLFAFFIPFWAYYLVVERWLIPLFG